jgi:hypothetical protein
MSEGRPTEGPWGSGDPRQQAEYLTSYYSWLTKEQGDKGIKWVLGLYMAKQWAELLHRPDLNIKDALFFYGALESQRHNQGSNWSQMILWVNTWLRGLLDVNDLIVEELSWLSLRNPQEFDSISDFREWRPNYSSSSPKTKT